MQHFILRRDTIMVHTCMRTASRGFVTWIYARDVYARIAPFLCVYYVSMYVFVFVYVSHTGIRSDIRESSTTCKKKENNEPPPSGVCNFSNSFIFMTHPRTEL